MIRIDTTEIDQATKEIQKSNDKMLKMGIDNPPAKEFYDICNIRNPFFKNETMQELCLDVIRKSICYHMNIKPSMFIAKDTKLIFIKDKNELRRP